MVELIKVISTTNSTREIVKDEKYTMFDHLERLMQRLGEGVQTMPLSIEIDDDGYFDRRCPWQECAFSFKVLLDDWKTMVADDAAYCPFCRHQAEASSFNLADQDTYIQQAVIASLQQELAQAMQADAHTQNQRQTPGFLQIRWDVHTPPQAAVVPPAALDAMRIRIECEACGCHFAVIGAAYFCPACGANSARKTIALAFAGARATMAALPTLDAIADQDSRAAMSKTLIEGTLITLVTAFQRYAEAEYPRLPGYAAPPRRNAFQSLDQGSALWVAAGGTAYATMLTPAEMSQLRRFFQQRHLLGHQEGMVDSDYITRSGDTTYVVGQRLVIREQAILQFTDILEKVVRGMQADLPA